MISRKQQNSLRFMTFKKIDILKDGIHIADIPSLSGAMLRRYGFDELPQFLLKKRAPTGSNMPIKADAAVLRQQMYLMNTGIQAV